MRSSFFHKTILAFAFLTLTLPGFVSADTLRLTPASGSYSSGQTFPVRVSVSSVAQSINAISGVVSFPSDKLQVVSLSKTNSILSLWVQEPSFSNVQGTVGFEGVVPNPGFTGTGGVVITINFRVIGPGEAIVKFDSGSVLANDGNGTNILKNLYQSVYSLGGVPDSLAPTYVEPVTQASNAPVIVSSTYPNPKIWYSQNSGQFTWNIDGGSTATRILLDKSAKSTPTNVYTPAIDSKEIPDIEDGIWYLHVGVKNSNGWTSTGSYLFKVDTTKPETFVVKEIANSDGTDPTPKFSVSATDVSSGIDYYSLQVDSETAEVWRDGGSGTYQIKTTGPGKHTLLAKAYDQAGNFAVTTVDFNIVGIESPRIISYSEQVTEASPLIVSGKALPNVVVNLYLAKGQENPIIVSIKSDDSGAFTGSFDSKLSSGVYKLWAVAVDKRGAQSEPSASKTVEVTTSWFRAIGSSLLTILATAIPLIALLFVLILMIIYGFHKIRVLRRKLTREVQGIEHIVEKAFDLIKEDIEDSIRMLEKVKDRRSLTKEEGIIIKRLRENLSEAEKVIRKEVRDVEKEIE